MTTILSNHEDAFWLSRGSEIRGMSRESRAVNNTLDTINAAATAIASAENLVPHTGVQKRRWGSWLSAYWCFGSLKNRKRINHAVLAPEPTDSRTDVARTENPSQAPASILPFVAPPSSPASFLQSEPPSVTQSPAGSLSLSSVSTSMYSPSGPASIFAIGPYAYETQLVSPPVFSSFTTEPSTTPFTPPPESLQLTTPSSPEVPFAQLFDPKMQNGEAGQRFPLSHYEFNSYQLHPGSPVGQLISPSSGISGSGTSSPFPDNEFAVPRFLEFQRGDPPKLFNLDKLSNFDWGSRQCSGSLTPDGSKPTYYEGFLLNSQTHEAVPSLHSDNRGRNNASMHDHSLSFELTDEDVTCEAKKTVASAECVSTSLKDRTITDKEENSNGTMNGYDNNVGDTSNDSRQKAPTDIEELQRHKKQRSITLGSIKEFNFDNVDGGDSPKSSIASDWWANENVDGKEEGETNNWSFFPIVQPSIS